ncbi:unnamed protein product, partial [Laminaria digitata]
VCSAEKPHCHQRPRLSPPFSALYAPPGKSRDNRYETQTLNVYPPFPFPRASRQATETHVHNRPPPPRPSCPYTPRTGKPLPRQPTATKPRPPSPPPVPLSLPYTPRPGNNTSTNNRYK